jgi:hypothetical protein
MLRLLAEANFIQLWIGIETPRKASLMEVHKVQNTKTDLVEDIRKIQSYGMFVTALMMVGFDNDDTSIFDELYHFLQNACITQFRLHQLQSFPGTPQTARLLKEGRVLELEGLGDENLGVSNVIPGGMTREELFEGLWRYKTVCSRGCLRRAVDRCDSRHQLPPAFALKMKLPDPKVASDASIPVTPPLVRKVASVVLPPLSRLARLRRSGKSDGFDGIGLPRFLKILDMLEPEPRKLVAAAMRETLPRAPWLVRDIFFKVMMHSENIRGAERQRARVLKRMEIEKSPGYRHKYLAAVQIPPEFKRVYKEQFGVTLQWLREGLDDHGLVAEGLVRVWKDFVIRYGATFKEFADYHIVSLKELVERTIEQGNGGQFSHTRSMAGVDNRTSFQIHLLSEQIMFSVEQDLKMKNRNLAIRLWDHLTSRLRLQRDEEEVFSN